MRQTIMKDCDVIDTVHDPRKFYCSMEERMKFFKNIGRSCWYAKCFRKVLKIKSIYLSKNSINKKTRTWSPRHLDHQGVLPRLFYIGRAAASLYKKGAESSPGIEGGTWYSGAFSFPVSISFFHWITFSSRFVARTLFFFKAVW